MYIHTSVKLYVSLVLCYVTDHSSVWYLHPHSFCSLLLKMSTFLHIKCFCSKKWSASYTFLFTYNQLFSASTNCFLFKTQLILLSQLLHKFIYLTPRLLHAATTPTKDLFSYHKLNLITDIHHTAVGLQVRIQDFVGGIQSGAHKIRVLINYSLHVATCHCSTIYQLRQIHSKIINENNP